MGHRPLNILYEFWKDAFIPFQRLFGTWGFSELLKLYFKHIICLIACFLCLIFCQQRSSKRISWHGATPAVLHIWQWRLTTLEYWPWPLLRLDSCQIRQREVAAASWHLFRTLCRLSHDSWLMHKLTRAASSRLFGRVDHSNDKLKQTPFDWLWLGTVSGFR